MMGMFGSAAVSRRSINSGLGFSSALGTWARWAFVGTSGRASTLLGFLVVVMAELGLFVLRSLGL